MYLSEGLLGRPIVGLGLEHATQRRRCLRPPSERGVAVPKSPIDGLHRAIAFGGRRPGRLQGLDGRRVVPSGLLGPAKKCVQLDHVGRVRRIPTSLTGPTNHLFVRAIDVSRPQGFHHVVVPHRARPIFSLGNGALHRVGRRGGRRARAPIRIDRRRRRAPYDHRNAEEDYSP